MVSKFLFKFYSFCYLWPMSSWIYTSRLQKALYFIKASALISGIINEVKLKLNEVNE